MIEAVFAQKFIEQVTQYTDYNINIMNENGVIIASRNPEGKQTPIHFSES